MQLIIEHLCLTSLSHLIKFSTKKSIETLTVECIKHICILYI